MVQLLKDIPFEEYLSWPDMSNSRAKPILESTQEFEKPFKETEPMKLGTELHSAILTPKDRCYNVGPDCKRNTKVGKELWNNFMLGLRGKRFITHQQNIDLEKMILSLNSNPTAQNILCAADHFEVSARENLHGMPFKARADILGTVNGKGFIGDIKSTMCAKPHSFQKAIFTYGYHIQAYIYTSIFECEDFYIIATENNGNFITEVYRLSQRAIKKGGEDLKKAIKLINEYYGGSLIDNYSRSHDIIEIDLPEYVYFD